MEMALSEATVVATSYSPRRASRGTLTTFKPGQPRRGGVGQFLPQNLPQILFDLPRTEPDVAPTGLINATRRILPHGWLAVGYRTAPALRASGRLQPLSKRLWGSAPGAPSPGKSDPERVDSYQPQVMMCAYRPNLFDPWGVGDHPHRFRGRCPRPGVSTFVMK